MPGSKPLTESEIIEITSKLKTPREKCLFILGLYTGFRVSELLSLTTRDLVQYSKIKDSVTVHRKNMKGKTMSRTVVLHKEAKRALELYLSGGLIDGLLFDFNRKYADRVLRRAVLAAEVEGKVSSHSMRKTFAKRVYDALNHDLVNTQRAMGHRSVQSTVSYLAFDQQAIDLAILGKSS